MLKVYERDQRKRRGLGMRVVEILRGGVNEGHEERKVPSPQTRSVDHAKSRARFPKL
jgi:hypothetical protein